MDAIGAFAAWVRASAWHSSILIGVSAFLLGMGASSLLPVLRGKRPWYEREDLTALYAAVIGILLATATLVCKYSHMFD